jgi:hypothetical protein
VVGLLPLFRAAPRHGGDRNASTDGKNFITDRGRDCCAFNECVYCSDELRGHRCHAASATGSMRRDD